MTAELKPCPFCGSKNVHPDTNGMMTWIICIGCDARGKRFFNSQTALKLAIEAWNRRAEDGKGNL